ncbi:Na+/H+ antiporter subunit E [Stappia stellulata]|uniref:Na+/H+ antiporter subunit E n=1 Tax=Stappia TaxID=152161 RepID=UPI001CD41B2E|nr:Na+/H+ antiporter subunit E [Stappia stellulata]MCA1242061.1 Na+/H+ antiporter subunit E [Stappia stellulata]
MTDPAKRLWAFAILCGVFLVELVKASVDVAIAVFSDKQRLRPAIVAVPLDLKTDMGIATLANLVSLTPGTTSLHVSEDRRTLYVHVLDRDSDEDVIDAIKTTFETRVRAVEPAGPHPVRRKEGAVA